jgi:hypothetical protein
MTWSSDAARTNLSRLYEWAERLATDAVEWYMTEKRRKAVWSRRLRALAALLATAGAAIPVAALAAGRPSAATWGYLPLALAAGCVGYDRFFGYSSAWLRYLTTATAIRGLLVDFELDWAARLGQVGERELQPGEIQDFVAAVRSFAASVNDLIRSETEAWRAEFGTRLSELEVVVDRGSPEHRG